MNDKMIHKYSKMFLLTGALLGFISGLMWFGIGSWLDLDSDFFVLSVGIGDSITGYLGNFASFFIVPVILPVLIAGVYLIIKFSRTNLIIAAVFVAVYYGCHWLPLGLLLLYFIIFNISF
jgi:hypothetical protein